MAALSFIAHPEAQRTRAQPSAASCVDDVLSAMNSAGIYPVEPIGAQLLQSGDKVFRFRCQGDKSGRKNGWAVFKHGPSPFAEFGNWRLGIREIWTAKGGLSELSPSEREAIEREIALSNARREKKIEAAALTARDQFASAHDASPDHPYLARKNIRAEKLRQHGNQVIVPIFDIDGKLASLQFISNDGGKRFLPGGKISGNFWLCGRPDSEICIGEGMATMAAVRRATGLAVVAALSANNLVPVAKLIRARRPQIRIIICADDDAEGIANAEKAANAVGGKVVRPLQSEARA